MLPILADAAKLVESFLNAVLTKIDWTIPAKCQNSSFAGHPSEFAQWHGAAQTLVSGGKLSIPTGGSPGYNTLQNERGPPGP